MSTDIKSLVSCSPESLELSGESVLIPNSLLEEYENIRLRQMIAEGETEDEAAGFSLFSTNPSKRRKNVVRPIIPRASESRAPLGRENMVPYERFVLDVPYKSLPCQAHFIRGNCPMGENCYFYHSVHNAAVHMRHVEPAHPIVLNYRIQKLAYERGQDHFVSNVQDKMEVLSGELQKTKRAKQEIIQQHAELQNNFLNATLMVQELESENKALRDLMKNMYSQRSSDGLVKSEGSPKPIGRTGLRTYVPRLGKSRGRGRHARCIRVPENSVSEHIPQNFCEFDDPEKASVDIVKNYHPKKKEASLSFTKLA